MMKCRIETITPCHIGSGAKLIKNVDFVISGRDDDRQVGVVCPTKIYQVLGEAAIDKWCAAIERRESIWKVVTTQKPDAKIEDICSRVLVLNGSECNELHEQITTNGVPYIPGSSIKGAIVSAIIGECREQISLPARIYPKNNIVAEQLLVRQTTNRQNQPTYDPKNSNLRFLRVGDAHFKGGDITVVECYGLNIREQQSLIDKTSHMLAECINCEQIAEVDIQLATDKHKVCGETVPPLPEAMRSEENLLVAINNHTRRLLREELAFWNAQEDKEYFLIESEEEQEELDYYLGQIRDMLAECNGCKSGREAILRVGYGGGWRFMTGHWIDEATDRWAEIARRVRRDDTAYYQQYDFPKTRRVGLGTPLGFIKITKKG